MRIAAEEHLPERDARLRRVALGVLCDVVRDFGGREPNLRGKALLHRLHQPPAHDKIVRGHVQRAGLGPQRGLGACAVVDKAQVLHEARARHRVAAVQAQAQRLAHQHFLIGLALHGGAQLRGVWRAACFR